jgi:glutamate synthase (NADPH/NADH) small chain
VIDRRVAVLEEEGIIFKTNAHVGVNIDANQLKDDFDAVVLCGGATVRRSIPIPGADLKGVTQAMDFLKLNNQYVDGLVDFKDVISAKGKDVIVIGGGDTGSDCIGTSNRHGATSVTNFEILSKPSEGRPANQPWPYWPMKLKTTSSHQEGVERFFSISTKAFIGDKKGNLTGLKTVEVEWIFTPGERPQLKEVPNTEKEWKCDIALLALGFTGAEKTLADQFGLKMDFRTNIEATTKDYKTNIPGVFAAGDMRRGQSLIVWAISEGRQAAYHIDTYLMGESCLPLKDDSDLPRV